MPAPWETDVEEAPPWEVEQSSPPWQEKPQAQPALEPPSGVAISPESVAQSQRNFPQSVPMSPWGDIAGQPDTGFTDALFNQMPRDVNANVAEPAMKLAGKVGATIANVATGAIAPFRMALGQGPMSAFSEPLAEQGKPVISGIEPPSDARGIVPSLRRGVAGFLTPEMLLTAPLAIESKALQAGFFGSTVASIPQALQAVTEAKTPAETRGALTDLALTGGMATLIGRGMAAETPTTKGANNAREITSTTSVPQPEVRSRMGQEAPLRQPGEVAEVPPSEAAKEVAKAQEVSLSTVLEMAPEQFFDTASQWSAEAISEKGGINPQVRAELAAKANPDLKAWQEAQAKASADFAEIKKEASTNPEAMGDTLFQKRFTGAAQRAQFFSEGRAILDGSKQPNAKTVELSAAPKEKAALDDLTVAIRVKGKPITGDASHMDIALNGGDADIIEAASKPENQGFVYKGEFISREKAAELIGEKLPLTSERLAALRAAEPTSASAAKEATPPESVASAKKLEPVQIPNDEGYGYTVVHESARGDTGKFQITTFDENGNPTGHTGNNNLTDALREAGYFKRESSAASDQQSAFFDARRAAKEAGDKTGEFAYVSAYRPFGIAPSPLKGVYWRNAGNKAVVFADKPISMELQKSLELTAVSGKAFNDLIEQKTKAEYPGHHASKEPSANASQGATPPTAKPASPLVEGTPEAGVAAESVRQENLRKQALREVERQKAVSAKSAPTEAPPPPVNVPARGNFPARSEAGGLGEQAGAPDLEAVRAKRAQEATEQRKLIEDQLVPAVQYKGKTYVGEVGETHAKMINRLFANDPEAKFELQNVTPASEQMRGFARKGTTEFIDRSRAAEMVGMKDGKPLYSEWLNELRKRQASSPAPTQGKGVSFFDVQSEAQGLGRPSTRPTVEDVRRQREQDAARTGEPPIPPETTTSAPGEIPPAPGAKTKESGGEWFAGKNPQETATMMQERASAFLEGKTDQQAIEDLTRLAGGDPNVQLDNQAVNFVIKDLLVRASNRAQKTTSPVEAVEAWSQVDRLAELSRRVGAEDARSLVSRKLAYRQIDWLMPVIAWRGIVKERWRKALGLKEGEKLNESAITPEEAQKRGLPELNGEATQKIAKLAREAEKLPQGVLRNKKMDEMVQEIQKGAPMSKLDLLRDVWYASVLSRVGTMINVLSGSFSTGASFTAMAALDRTVRLHPLQAIKIIGQFIGGTFEGTLIADQVARKGAWHLLPDAELRFSNLLSGKSGARFDNLEALLRRGNPIGVLAYTKRFMAALDYIGAEGTRDAQVLYAALTRGDREGLDALDRRFDRSENQRAGEQAKAEMGPKASRAEVLVRKREILEQGVSVELKEAAVNTARRAAQNANPRGIPGIVYQAASKLPFWVRAPTGLAFIRAGMNMVQNAVDYMPGPGAISAARGYLGALPEGHPFKRFGMDIPIEERRMMWAAQGVSLGIAATAAAMFLGDDKDEGMEISGSWRGLDPKKRSQLMELGERPNSVRFGKKGPWISFKQMPFAPPLAIIGTMRDEERFHAKEWNGDSAASKITAAWLGGLLYVRDLSALSGIAGMFDGNAWSTQEKPSKMTEQLSRWAAQSAGRAASGYIPSIIKEIDEFGDTKLYRPGKDELMGYWIRNIPYARRTVGSGPALNNFGEPIQLTPPPLKAWVGFGKDGELYNTLGMLASKGIFVPEPDRNAKVVVNGNRRSRTEDEWYQFIKFRGPLLKSSFTPNDLQWLKTASHDDAVGWLKERTDSAREAARTKQKL